MNRSSREALVEGLTELDRIVKELDLDSPIQNRATEIYRNAAQTEDLLPGRGIENIIAGCVVLAARESNEIVDAEDVADVTSEHIQEKTVHRTTKYLRNELDLGFLLADPHKHVDPVGDALGATDHDKELVREIVDLLLDDGIASGRKAQSITGSTYYAAHAIGLTDGEFTQREVADAADITEVTIRNNYRDFAKVANDEFDTDFDITKHRSAT